MIVRHVDLAGPPRFCNRGARQFCARHGINWQSFMEHGVDASVLIAIGDEMGLELVRRAEARLSKEGGTE